MLEDSIIAIIKPTNLCPGNRNGDVVPLNPVTTYGNIDRAIMPKKSIPVPVNDNSIVNVNSPVVIKFFAVFTFILYMFLFVKVLNLLRLL